MNQLLIEHSKVRNIVQQYYPTLANLMRNIAQFCNKGDSFTVNTLAGSITFKVE